MLLAAMSLASPFPQMKVLLVGDGSLRPALERFVCEGLVAKQLRDRVIFAGLVRPDYVASHIGIMDAVVHLSRREGLARVLPQALAAGKPVVAYDCDGAREVCLDNETGFLVKPGDLETAARQLLELITKPDLREQMGNRGRALVKEQFPVQRMVNDLHALYLRLSAKNP